MFKAYWKKYTLEFKRPSGTSRGVLKKKSSWFIFLEDENGNIAIGECGLLRGLSSDDVPNYEAKVDEICQNIQNHQYWLDEGLLGFPSIRFGLEMALQDYETGCKRELFPSDFTNKNAPISINGLIWMGEKSFMFEQIKSKIEQGFSCIKLKIGAINFEEEVSLLSYIRQHFSKEDIELRVDANGAFSPKNALEKLKRLSTFDLHSIEQPIRQGQLETMAELCQKTPLDIALDEELIGIEDKEKRKKTLDIIQPQYIILKPSLVGGFKDSSEWISLAEERNIAWWLTSCLESNIGLSAISQWTHTLNNPMPQGLGTGQLYTNNIPSPLEVRNGNLYYDKDKKWNPDKMKR